MNLVPVDLIAVISEEAQEGILIGEARGVPVVNLAENDPPTYIMGSASHLKSLFSNLIRNAICYSYENAGRVEISVELSQKKVAVKVRDEGIGIPSNNLNKIFEDHFRSKNAVAHYADGTGLGLSIVKEVVVLHGASIDVESTVGKGSCFTVRFDIIEPK
jgi:signal transduction histidine kinase